MGSRAMDDWQYGFRISNNGEAAIDVRVKRLQISPQTFASSDALPQIPAYENAFIPVFLEAYKSAPDSPEKWSLLNAMKKAYEARDKRVTSEDYVIPIIAKYRDLEDNEYESTAELHYVPARQELTFGATRQRKANEPPNAKEEFRHEKPVLDFLDRHRIPNQAVIFLVDDVSTCVGLSGADTAAALNRLFAKKRVYRSPIDARWDFGYWLADF